MEILKNLIYYYKKSKSDVNKNQWTDVLIR